MYKQCIKSTFSSLSRHHRKADASISKAGIVGWLVLVVPRVSTLESVVHTFGVVRELLVRKLCYFQFNVQE